MNSEDGAMDDRCESVLSQRQSSEAKERRTVLEVESSEVVADTDAIGDGEVPVLPESLAVVEDDALAEVMRRVADELDAVPKRLAVSDGFLVPVAPECQ